MMCPSSKQSWTAVVVCNTAMLFYETKIDQFYLLFVTEVVEEKWDLV